MIIITGAVVVCDECGKVAVPELPVGCTVELPDGWEVIDYHCVGEQHVCPDCLKGERQVLLAKYALAMGQFKLSDRGNYQVGVQFRDAELVGSVEGTVKRRGHDLPMQHEVIEVAVPKGAFTEGDQVKIGKV